MSKKIAEQFAKPAATGLIAYLGSQALLPQSTIAIGGQNINSNIFYGILGVGGSFVAETAHNWILPYIPGNGRYAKTESYLVSPVATAGVFALGTKMFLTNSFGGPPDLMYPAMLGGASEIGGQYVFDAVLEPYLR